MQEINKLVDIVPDYSDIINLDRPISYHKKMSIDARASQFAPFAALTGYSDEIKETERITDKKIDLSEDKMISINKKLEWIQNNIKNKPLVEIDYFIKDKKKEGGEYIKYKGRVKKIDNIYKKVIFEDKTIIEINNIKEIDFV